MEKIKTIRLYRYNIGITEENDCTEYMTMDYFDSFDVEEEEDIISGCIGNGEKYSYLAMQEMCFKCDEIFRMPDGEKSFFTLIQIFVNPDFIYSDQEDEDDKVSYILKKYIDKFVAYVQEKCKVDYQVFPLITAGDYLVCIRSNDIHVAYDISTVLRDLYFEMGQKRCLLFTTYSILGMKNDIILTDEKLQQLHINEKDLVSIRGIFSDRYREADLEMNPSIDREEYQLYGRYDQTVDIPLHDYLQMQNFLVLYKKGKFNEAAECIECFMSKEYQDIKSKELLEKISKGYFSYWNERILLYKRDDFSEFRTNKEQFCVANLPQRKFLKQINTELYIECEELLRDIKEHQTMWERERINTYYNLLERLLEISKNLNYQRGIDRDNIIETLLKIIPQIYGTDSRKKHIYETLREELLTIKDQRLKEVCIELLQIEIKFDVMEDLYDICNKGNEKMKFIGYINLIIMKKDSLSLEECNVIEKFFREKEEYIGSDIARNLYDIIKKFKRGGNKGGFIENREYIGNKEIQLSKLEHKEKNWGFFENINISESDINKYSEFDLRKELEKKFDELFGPID